MAIDETLDAHVVRQVHVRNGVQKINQLSPRASSSRR